MSVRARIPPFALQRPVGRGGMAVVWKAVHEPTGTPVAIKVLTTPRAREPRYVRSILREVEAIAALDHTGIVAMYDHGEVGPQPGGSEEGIVPGAPWVAMELASGGSLFDNPPPTWTALRRALLAILDALAHAHANGVVHRDLKPANVLLCSPTDLRPGLKLTDFGLAFPLEHGHRSQDRRKVSGTPEFMAPEQFARAWRDFGPWTDLYALGCLAWRLTTGRPLFHGERVDVIGSHHRQSPVPKLSPLFSVPTGFQEWLESLLNKSPRDRPPHAAQAKAALLRLGRARGRRGDPEVTGATLIPQTGANPTDQPGARRCLPVPATWPGSRRIPMSTVLDHSGLGLIGLREPPVLGRQAEQKALWRTLVQTAETGKAHLVVLRGPAGVGKSRLARWLAVEADAAGVIAAKLVAYCRPGHEDQGLAGMLRRTLVIHDLDLTEASQRVSELGFMEARRLAGVGLGEADDDPVGVVHRFAASLADRSEGPIIMWLDDAHWGDEALRLASRILRRRDVVEAPILVVLTLSDNALGDAGKTAASLQTLTRRPGARSIWLDHLDARATAALVRETLGLDPTVAVQVEDRSGGNPMMALQMVRDWAQRGYLVPGPIGFTLRADSRPGVPTDVNDLWTGRIEGVLAGLLDAECRAFDVAALLGSVVDHDEWEAACVEAQALPTPRLIARLVSAKLVRREEGGLAFVQEMVREAALARTQRQQTAGPLHAACARALEALVDAPRRDERWGLHLFAAGQLLECMPPLRQGVLARLQTYDYTHALSLLDVHDRARSRSDIPLLDPRVEEAQHLRVLALSNGPSLDRGAELCRTCIAFLDDNQPSRRHARCRMYLTLGQILFRKGELPQAGTALDRAYALCDERYPQTAHVTSALGHVAQARNDLISARQWYLRTLAYHHSNEPTSYALAKSINDLAEIDRLEGDLHTAEKRYRKAYDLAADEGQKDQIISMANLALVAYQRGDLASARKQAEAIFIPAREWGQALAASAAHALILICSAHSDDWASWDEHLSSANRIIHRRNLVNREIANLLEDAGHAAATRDRPEQARGAWNLALRQRRHLRDTEGMRRLEAAIRDQTSELPR